MMQLNLRSDDGDAAVVAIEGRVTPESDPSDTDPLTELLGASVYGRKVLLDFEKCEFIDSSGISWLLVAHKRFREAGGAMALFAIPPMIDQVLKVLRMNRVFGLADDETSARQLVMGTEE